MQAKKIFFLSDFHLGSPTFNATLPREKLVIEFLDSIQNQAEEIFILGDIFDFWYEYKKVVPKGGVRLLGKLAQLTDAGIPVHFFVGNHDMWMSTYFKNELNIPLYFNPTEFIRNGKKFLIGHGDGLGPKDYGYKFIKKVFRHPLNQAMFGLIPPSIGFSIATYFSRRSRKIASVAKEKFLGPEKEWLILFCNEVLKQTHYDFFIFGHRHLPIDFRLNQTSRYINTGEWMNFQSYAEFDNQNIQLKSFTGKTDKLVIINE